MTKGSRSQFDGLSKILLFMGLLALLLYTIDFAVNYGLRRVRTSSFGISNLVVDGKINAQIVISGSSRALTHYDARIIQKTTGHTAYTIGRNGSQTDMQLAFLKTYLRHNQKPQLIIHNLDLFSFLTSHEIYDPAQYLPYLKEEAIYSEIKRVYPDAWKWKYIPLYGYLVTDMRLTWIQGLASIAGVQPKQDYFQGYQPRYTQWTGDFEKYRQENPAGVKFEIEPLGFKYLREIAAICHEQGISLLFVYSPEYSEMQSMEANRAEIFAKFGEICREFNTPLWDFSNSSISYQRTNFYNSQHLNATGSEAFSVELARKLSESNLLK